ncbi:unnamed protein product [Ostreobium quekettii]|uniref:DOMON domain-containing protein n=1 Tax=Ostreobium quekettii TaxID=121088 RepID=A0A8S1IVE6_9CHLO|nr:unnamed protein product [Ostreobium quekettii]
MAVHWVLGPVSGENLAPSAPTPSGGEISILLEGNTTGWLSLSFADTALSMSPADAVLGWVEADGAVVVKSYRIAAKSVSASNEDADVPLTNIAGSETDGVTVIEYTRALNAGAFPINASSPSIRVNAAHGADGEDSLVYHGTNRAAFTADLVAEQQEVEDATPVGPGPAPAAPEEDATMPCQLASNKNGYACMTTIPGVDAMTVHWVVGPVSGTGFNDSAPTPSKGDISILMEGNTTGWLGFAFGGSALAMNPADAVLGWVEEGGTVVAKSYKITRKGISDSDEDPAIPLADVRGSQLDGVTTIEFTRAMNAGQFPINITAGPVRTNAAHGDEDSLSYHGANRNSFMTNFTIGQGRLRLLSRRRRRRGVFVQICNGSFYERIAGAPCGCSIAKPFRAIVG